MSKARDLRQKTDQELRDEVKNLTQGMFNLRFRKVTDVEENPAQYKMQRREIARIHTILRERKK